LCGRIFADLNGSVMPDVRYSPPHDLDIIWEIVTHDLPGLIRDIDNILKNTGEGPTSAP
jgi:hypothetical protein